MPKFPPDTPPDMKRLLNRIEFWQRKLQPLGLRQWRPEVTYTEEVEGTRYDAVASCSTSTHYDSVWFQFQQEYVRTQPRWKLDETIIHEWLHVLFRDLDAAVGYAEDYMAPQVREMWDMQVEHERERLIESLARTIRMLYHGHKQ